MYTAMICKILPYIEGVVFNVYYMHDCKSKQNKTIKVINNTFKIIIYKNYCMFETPNLKPVQSVEVNYPLSITKK